jgi:hypothetical protein
MQLAVQANGKQYLDKLIFSSFQGEAMKLVLQIALGVFLGTLSSQLLLDSWHSHQENIAKASAEKIRAEQQKARMEQGERIRNLILQSRQGSAPDSKKLPDGFVPDDDQGQ